MPGSGWPRLEPPALHTERYEVTTGGSHVSVCHSRFLISVGIFGMYNVKLNFSYIVHAKTQTEKDNYSYLINIFF